MAARWHVISAAARQALEAATVCDGPLVTITRQLDPAVWRDVKIVLEALGAVYVPRSSAFEFAADRVAETLLRDALAAGKVMPEKGLAGFVPTPVPLAEHLVRWYAEFPGRHLGARVLEPSAGTGRIVDAIVDFLGPRWVDVTAVEADRRRARQIQTGEHISVHHMRIEDYALKAQTSGERFDAVLMNPPFAVPGNPTLWVDHLLLAWELLAVGGRLVAITPASVLDDRRRNRRIRAARELVRVNGAATRLDDDEFAESGVRTATAIVWLDRPQVEPGPRVLSIARHPALLRRYQGNEPPVPVARPYLTRAAARSMPVQVWYDSWRSSRRIFRYRAECAECGQPLWAFDDGENDPRGVLGDNTGCYFVDAIGEEVFAAPVGLCPACTCAEGAEDRAIALARRLTAQQPDPTSSAAARPQRSRGTGTKRAPEALALFDADAL